MTDTHKTVMIAGQSFDLPIMYFEGHQVSKIEAKVLSQTWCENVRNNTAKFIKQAEDEDDEMTMDAAHNAVVDYASAYVFTAAAAAGSRASVSPEEKEAKRMAREGIRAQLIKEGRKIGDIDKDKLAAAIEEVSQRDEMVKLAKKRVKEQVAAGEAALENISLD